MRCNRCEGTGFLNTHLVDKETVAAYEEKEDNRIFKHWIEKQEEEHDVFDCDCCDGSGAHSWDEKIFDCM
jgi:hypothetical protein